MGTVPSREQRLRITHLVIDHVSWSLGRGSAPIRTSISAAAVSGTCLSLARLARRVDLVALLAVTLVAARQVDADLAASVRRGTFIDVCK